MTETREAHGDAGYPKESYAWYVVGILFLVTVFSQLDRQLPTLLVDPIRAEFNISDTSFSYLQGYAFAIVYTLAGLPLGRMVDRTNRRNLILFGLVFWSSMTLFSGLAQSYTQLFIGRMGVGVGEAVLAPAAYSIISDYVRPERRGRALAVYYVSLAIGSGASLLIGGLISQIVPDGGMAAPLFGHLDSWRWTFIMAGAPGILVASLLFTVREPIRQEQGGKHDAGDNPSVGEVLAYLRTHISTFGRLLFYPSVLAIIGYGSLAWAPSTFLRKFDIPTSQSGLILGVIIAVGGATGTLLSGFLSDRWLAQGRPSARFRVTLVGQLLMVPTVWCWSLMSDPWLAYGLLAIAITGLGIAQSAAPASIQEVTPNRMRGQVVAIYLLLGGLLGIGLGPTMVAWVTDYVFKDDSYLPISIAVTAAPATLLGLWLCWSGQKPYARTRAMLHGDAD